MRKFSTVYQAAMRKAAGESILRSTRAQATGAFLNGGSPPRPAPAPATTPRAQVTPTNAPQAIQLPRTPTIRDYRRQLWINMEDRDLDPRVAPGTTNRHPRDLAGQPGYEDLGYAGYLKSRGLTQFSPWDDKQYLATQTRMNLLANPFDPQDARYPLAEQYIRDRTNENRELMRRGELINNPEPKVKLPQRLQGTKEGLELERKSFGFANAAQPGSTATAYVS